MKNLLIILTIAFFIPACATNKQKALKEKNELKAYELNLGSTSDVSGNDYLGVRDNKVVVQRKVLLSEQLRKLKNETYGLEFEVYGNRDYGTKGLYGVYRDCLIDLNSKNNGGDGKVQPIEDPAPVLKDEPDMLFTKDERGNLIGVSEEYLSERIDRYKKFKEVLNQRREEYERKVRVCKNDLKNTQVEEKQSSNTVY